MKHISWNFEKNCWLVNNRGVSFEDAAAKLLADDVLTVIEHPNPGKYGNQKMFIMNIRNYAWLVPFVETEEEIFLKTMIPSRKATKRYLGGNDGIQ